jgi:hypothetical protein
MGCLQIGVQLNGYWIELVIPLALRSAMYWVAGLATGGMPSTESAAYMPSQRRTTEPLLLSRVRVHDMACSLRSAPVLR